MEKIRELISLLESGIEDYDAQLKVLQAERLKYIRLSMTDGFGTEKAILRSHGYCTSNNWKTPSDSDGAVYDKQFGKPQKIFRKRNIN